MIVGCVGVDVVVGLVLVVVVVRVVVTGGTGDEVLHDAVGGHNPASSSEESTPAAWRPVNKITFAGKEENRLDLPCSRSDTLCWTLERQWGSCSTEYRREYRNQGQERNLSSPC